MQHRYFILSESNVRTFLVITLSTLSLGLFSQQLKCCQSIADVEIYLTGKWKEKGANSTIYDYSFKDGKGLVVNLKSSESKETYELLTNPSSVEIISYGDGFRLKYIYLHGEMVTDLKYLNTNQLKLVNDGKEIEYYRIH